MRPKETNIDCAVCGGKKTVKVLLHPPTEEGFTIDINKCTKCQGQMMWEDIKEITFGPHKESTKTNEIRIY